MIRFYKKGYPPFKICIGYIEHLLRENNKAKTHPEVD